MFAPLFENGQVVGVVDIITDATDRVLAFRGLEARIGAFTRIAAASAVDQPLAVTLREVVAALRESVDVAAASIVSWADGTPTAIDDGAFGEGIRRRPGRGCGPSSASPSGHSGSCPGSPFGPATTPP